MADPRPREVRDVFQQEIHDNNSVLSELSRVLTDTNRDLREAESAYRSGIEKFVNGLFEKMDAESLSKLSRALTLSPANKRNERFDIEDEYDQKVRNSNLSANQLQQLIEKHGTPDELKNEIAAKEGAMQQLRNNINREDRTFAKAEARLKGVDGFNLSYAKTGKSLLQEGSLDYFKKKGNPFSHLWAVVTDSHYRWGRAEIKAFDKGRSKEEKLARLTVADVQKQRQDAHEAAEAAALSWKSVGSDKSELSTVLQTMNKLANGVLTHDEILQSMKQRVHSSLENRDNFVSVIKTFGDTFPVGVVEARGKQEAYTKLKNGLDIRVSALKKTTGQLEKPMANLNKAVRNSVTKPIRKVDLPKIKSSMQTMRQQTKTVAQQANNVRLGVKNHALSRSSALARVSSRKAPTGGTSSSHLSSQGNSSSLFMYGNPLDTYYNFLLFDMITDTHDHACNVDAGAVHATMGGIPDTLMQDVSMSALGAAVDTIPNLDADFNGVAAGVDGLVPDFNDVAANVDMPSFDMPSFDFSVPDIQVDIPTIDINLPDLSGIANDIATGIGDSFSGFDSF